MTLAVEVEVLAESEDDATMQAIDLLDAEEQTVSGIVMDVRQEDA